MDRDRQTDDKDSLRPITEAWQKRGGAFWPFLPNRVLSVPNGSSTATTTHVAPSFVVGEACRKPDSSQRVIRWLRKKPSARASNAS